MKLAFIVIALCAFSAAFATTSKIDCMKNALKSGKSAEQAYQLCSIKSK